MSIHSDPSPDAVPALAEPTERLFRMAVEASPHGMIVVNAEGRIVLLNQAIERMFGYQRGELPGQPIETLVPAHTRARHQQLRATFRADGSRAGSISAGRGLCGRGRDGSEIPLEISFTPLDAGDGTFVLVSVLAPGPRTQVEEELRRSNEELERFAYVASHDLQEPLRTVASYLQLLSRRYRDRLDADALEFIDFAVGGARQMQRLIEDLLAFSRVGTRGAPLVPTSLQTVFDGTLASLRAALDESHAAVTAGPLPMVAADAGQLAQLLTNLIGNAPKFRGNDPPRVHVEAARTGRMWTVSVEDNGIGIAPEYFDRIFVIFQRLHSREEYNGTGVGLAICKKIVERHGGRIWVESAPGRGARFRFTLQAATD